MKKASLVFVLTILILPRLSACEGGREKAVAPRTPGQGASRLAELLGADERAAFPAAVEPRSFRFPADHGPHPAFRNEWWYVTGNLDADRGRRFGFELTIFRFALSPTVPSGASNWRTNQVYVGHLAVTDVAGEAFHVAERYARGALGLAGASGAPFRVWLEDWEIAESARAAPSVWRLRARDGDVGVDLRLTPVKAPVLNGEEGLSQKSAEPGNASYYYSIPRLETEGTLSVGGRSFRVEGNSWLDREWGSSALAPYQQGWDWFALQLDDDTELMYYNLRRRDGSRDPFSAGTFVGADGRSMHLDADDVELEITDTWESPLGGRYPMGWRLRVADLGLALEVVPVMKGQELATNVRYWEGAVDVRGRRRDRQVGGRGYVELTGYAEDTLTTRR